VHYINYLCSPIAINPFTNSHRLGLRPLVKVMVEPAVADSSPYPAQVQQLRQLLGDQTKGEGWDIAWKNNITPWDRGDTQPALRDFVESNKIAFSRTGKALVPGCGRGYDAVYIGSKLGLQTIGMDISATAIEAANLNLKNTNVPEGTKISFQVENFFEYRVSDASDKFDLCYDYTFFVALPPSLRPAWGSQMRSLVKEGGYLITLIFPIDGDRSDGPPFSVNTEIYKQALQGDSGGVAWTKVLEEETTNDERKGRERIAVWKRN